MYSDNENNKPKPRVVAVIPCYNTERHISEVAS